MKPLHIFCDETGTLTNVNVKELYGFGWVVVGESKVRAVENLLKENDLDKIHVKNIRGRKRKVKLAEKLNTIFGGKDLVMGGSVIRKDPEFVKGIVDRNINKQKINFPSHDFSSAEAKQYKVVRLQEIAFLATRYALLGAIRKFGIREVNIHFSAVIDEHLHGCSIKSIEDKILNGLNELIAYSEKLGLMKIPGLVVPSNININVKAKSDEIFGLADFFASIGNLAMSEDQDRRNCGCEMYESAKNLFPERFFLEGVEPLPGIFVRD